MLYLPLTKWRYGKTSCMIRQERSYMASSNWAMWTTRFNNLNSRPRVASCTTASPPKCSRWWSGGSLSSWSFRMPISPPKVYLSTMFVSPFTFNVWHILVHVIMIMRTCTMQVSQENCYTGSCVITQTWCFHVVLGMVVFQLYLQWWRMNLF